MANLILFIVLPLVFSNSIHMIVVKKQLFPNLAKPISGALFGQNKTWRGFIIVPILNGVLALLLSYLVPSFSVFNVFFYGFLLGFVYMLFELPNSFLKRRVGIQAGEKANKYSWFFMLIDKCDSTLGVSLYAFYLFNLDATTMFYFFIFAVMIHISISQLLVLIKVKRRF